MGHGELWNQKVEKQEISNTYLYLSFVILRFFCLTCYVDQTGFKVTDIYLPL